MAVLKKILFVFVLVTGVGFAIEMHVQELVCRKVVGGDILLLSNGEKVKLIGVETPEFSRPKQNTQYYTKESVLFAKKIVEGKEVRLEYDTLKKDKYERTLAYVYTKEGIFLNAEIIKQGYGFVVDKPAFKYLTQFLEYEKLAKEKQIGLWKGGGEFELYWTIRHARKPVRVYSMSNNLWGLEYGNFVKPRVKSEELLNEITTVAQWAEQYDNKTLADNLMKSGWMRK